MQVIARDRSGPALLDARPGFVGDGSPATAKSRAEPSIELYFMSGVRYSGSGRVRGGLCTTLDASLEL